MYLLVCYSDCEGNDVIYYKGTFSTPEKAKEIIELEFKNTSNGADSIPTRYEYVDTAGGCFKVTIHCWGLVNLELILPEIDKYID